MKAYLMTYIVGVTARGVLNILMKYVALALARSGADMAAWRHRAAYSAQALWRK